MSTLFRTCLALSLFVAGQALAAQPWSSLTLDDVDPGYYVHHSDTSIALDQDGKIHISYRGPGRITRYITNRTGTGMWRAETVFSNRVSTARENALAVDANGVPHLSFSFSDGSAEDLMHASKRADGTWDVATVYTVLSAGMENDIALDHQGIPHISHWQWNGADLLYSTRPGTGWTTATLADANWDKTAIGIDSLDGVHLVYRSSTQLLHHHAGSAEVIAGSVTGESGPAVAIDQQDHLHVSYTSGGDLRYATNQSGVWAVTTIAQGARSGRHHAIAVDPQGKVHVSFLDAVAGALVYATNASGAWSRTTVDSGAETGHSSSIAVGEEGRVAISYRFQNIPTAQFYGLWGSSPSDLFLAGSEGRIVHYDGAAFEVMPSGVTSTLYDLWGDSPSNVFGVGSIGTVVRYDGNQWLKVPTGVFDSLFGVWGSSGSVFAAGTSGTILRYDGASWTRMSTPVSEPLHAIWGTSVSDVFAAGGAGTILHYDGSTWSAMSSGTNQELRDVWGSSPSDVFVVGRAGTILHYDGSQWTKMTSGTTRDLHEIWGRGAGDVFAVGDLGTILRYDGLSWQPMDSRTTARLEAVWGGTSGGVFAVGDRNVARLDGTSWTDLISARLRVASNCGMDPQGRCLPPPGPASDFWTLIPCRVLDTRDTAGPTGGAALVSGAEERLAMAGRCGIPTTAVAVSANVTVIHPTGAGHLQVYPAGTSVGTSLLNFRAGQVRANNAILGLAPDAARTVALLPFLQSGGAVHVVVDVNGYFAPPPPSSSSD